MRLYDLPLSPNGYKARLALANLGHPYEHILLDPAEGTHKQAAFLARNPLGRTPVLELPSGETVFESNAILAYLAEGTRLLPTEHLARARVLQWMFFEQADIARNVGVPRFIVSLAGRGADFAAELARLREAGIAALTQLDQHIARHRFLAGEAYSIADIALYAWVSVAHEGGYAMRGYENLAAWAMRVEAEPGWFPLARAQAAA